MQRYHGYKQQCEEWLSGAREQGMDGCLVQPKPWPSDGLRVTANLQ